MLKLMLVLMLMLICFVVDDVAVDVVDVVGVSGDLKLMLMTILMLM